MKKLRLCAEASVGDARLPTRAPVPPSGSQQSSTIASSSSPTWTFRRQGFTFEPSVPFCLELCAGSARLTATLRQVGLDAWGVDHKHAKIQPETHAMLTFDLTSSTDVAALWRLLEHPLLAYVHMAPPCGTCSRARERAVQGVPGGGPPPLRSDDFPEGFPDLQVRLPDQFARVTAANAIYRLLVDVAVYLLKRRVAWGLENPKNSLFWNIGSIAAVLCMLGVDSVSFQHCMYGGTRDKWTSIYFSPPGLLSSLRRVCDGGHVHEPWGRTAAGAYATAVETVYPQELCDAIRECLLRGLRLPRAAPLVLRRARGDVGFVPPRDDRAAAGSQPRGARSRRLLPEFKKTLWLPGTFAPTDQRCRIGHVWPEVLVGDVLVPADSKTIAVQMATASPPASAQTLGWTDTQTVRARMPTRGCLLDVGVGSLGDGNLYIGRAHRTKTGKFLAASPWSNPHKLKDCRNIVECLDRFRAYLGANDSLQRRLAELAGKCLVCHCRFGSPCHADVLVEAFARAFDAAASCSGITVGVPFLVSEFVDAAARVKHPFELMALPSPLEYCVRFRMTSSLRQVITFRSLAVEKLRRRALELEDKEKQLHAAMHDDVRGVVKGKRLLLLGELLSEVGFPGWRNLVHHMSTGFPVAGAYPATGVFPPSVRSASTSIQDLWRSCKEVQSKIMERRRGAEDGDLDAQVHAATLKEVERGWLSGPHTASDLDKRLGRWVPSRRFGVRQGDKVRCIDDFAASGINDALSAVETVDPDGLDRIAVNVRAHMDAFTAPEEHRPKSSPFAGNRRHQDHAEARIVAKMWDLESAYRQLPRAPGHASLTVIACWSPELGEHIFFEQTPLAFGASSSVLSFNWAAEALKMILIQTFAIAVTNFYDDYTVIELEALAANAKEIVDQVFTLLGWNLKELPDFAAESSPLGAVLDLSRCRDGLAVIRNKPSRVAEIVESINAAGSAAMVPADLLPRIRGRLLHARSLSFGRCGGDALRALGVAIQGVGSRVAVKGWLAHTLFNLRRHLLEARPREIRVSHPSPPLLFVDGAFEPDEVQGHVGSIGGILLDPIDFTYSFFRARISQQHVDFLLGVAGKTAIFQLELLPVLIGRLLWAERLRNRSLICFCDNDAAKGALISGYSGQPIAIKILTEIAKEDVAGGVLTWYDRVPTASNPADPPSRLCLPEPLPGWKPPSEVDGKALTDVVLEELRIAAVKELTGTEADPRCFSAGAVN